MKLHDGRTAWISSETYTLSAARCRESVKAITYYREAFRKHREEMNAEGPVARVWYQDCDVVRRRATEWRERAGQARAQLVEWKKEHWAWREWLPRGWYGVGSCETGYGGDPNWQHNSGTYQGAFGFHHDSWDGFVGAADQRWGPYPSEAYLASPRQQYEVALAIYRRYGLSGWGCRGAYYSWGSS